MQNPERTPILYAKNDQAEAAILLAKALALVGSKKSTPARQAKIDRLIAYARDYRDAAISRSMGAMRPEQRQLDQSTRKVIQKLAEDSFATNPSDELPLPSVDIDRADLLDPLVLMGEDARLALDGLDVFASAGDEFDQRQVTLFLDSHRLDVPVEAPSARYRR